MSYRELQQFCEIMRSLGYNRLISMENFKKPNFELVADILYWLSMRIEPNANISDDIDEEKDRVEFIKQICILFDQKTRIRMNMKKVYQSDGRAVQEILKVAEILYKAQQSQGNEDTDNYEFNLPAKLQNLKQTRQVAQEISQIGGKLYDLIGKEPELKLHRDKAIQFLENISRNLESNNEQQYIEKCVSEIIEQQQENINQMKQYVQNLEKDEKTLEEKIKKRQLDLERVEKRMVNLINVKPAYMDEYLRLEKELERLYSIYLEKFRNLDYLEHQIDRYNQDDQNRFEDSQKALQRIQKKIKEEEWKVLRGDQEVDESLLDQQINEADAEFGKANKNEKMNKMGGFGGKDYGGVGQQQQQQDSEDEDGEEDGDDDEEEDEDDQVNDDQSDDNNF